MTILTCVVLSVVWFSSHPRSFAEGCSHVCLSIIIEIISRYSSIYLFLQLKFFFKSNWRKLKCHKLWRKSSAIHLEVEEFFIQKWHDSKKKIYWNNFECNELSFFQFRVVTFLFEPTSLYKYFHVMNTEYNSNVKISL